MLLSLRTALTSLNTAQSALSVVANNVANVNTQGYSRQRVVLGNLGPTSVTASNLPVGRGVEIASLDRVSNALLNDQIREQQSFVGRYAASFGFLDGIEAAINEPGGIGVSSNTAAFFASLNALTESPENAARRTDVIQSARNLADGFRTVDRQLVAAGQRIDDAIRTEVSQINSLLREISDLNQTLGASSLQGAQPSDFLDQQDRLLRDLSERVDLYISREQDGRVSLYSGGNVLVTPALTNEIQIETGREAVGGLSLSVGSRESDFAPSGGRLRGLMDLAEGTAATSRGEMDVLARNMILEFNRVFSTGVPAGGGYTSLTATNRIQDLNFSGSFLDERLGQAGLPFQISNGRLTVNVTDPNGEISRTNIAIDEIGTSVGDLVNALDGITGLNAFVDNLGQLRINAQGGYAFDFSTRVIPNGDPQNTFGSTQATVVGSTTNPINIPAGSSFDIDVNGTGPVTINIANAHTSLESLVTELNTSLSGVGAQAVISQGAIAIRSNSAHPATSTIQLTEGANSPLAALGLSTTLTSGSSKDVTVTFGGSYADTVDRQYTFTPNMAGTIGSTAGLEIEVRDQTGALITTLDVGADYEAGTELRFADGLTVAFGIGTVDPDAGQRVQATFLGDSDTSDLLPALGLAGLFSGSNAGNIGVRDDLLNNPDLFAAGLTAAIGNGDNLNRLTGLQSQDLSDLNGLSFERFYEGFVTDVAIETNRARSTRDSQQAVLNTLEARRDSISGVNLDEELLLLEQYQQMYQASSRFIQVIQEVTDELFTLI